MKKYLLVSVIISGFAVFAGTASVARANQAPIGYFDSITNGVAAGWTVDPDVPGTPISVDFYMDGANPTTGTYLGRILANTPRPDVTAAYPTYTGNHGFTYTIPAQYLGGNTTHTLYAYGIDSAGGANTLLIGSPKSTAIANQPPVGSLDAVNSSGVTLGWAVDPNVPTTSISVDIYIDGPAGSTGTFLGRVTANTSRPDVTAAFPADTGNHGFTFSIPGKYFDNKPHTIYAYGIDSAGGANTMLPGSPKTFTMAPSNPLLGVTWTEATDGASFSGRLGHSSVVFNNKMWIIGGYNGDENYLNDVWSSSDGVTWTQVTKAAAFSPRRAQTSVVFNNKMWVIGGLDSNGNTLNDVWSSSDGVNWIEATNAAAFSPRRNQTSLVFNNEMWVIGGYDGSNPLNDVWSSSDGVNWTEATKAAAFSPRRGQTSVVFNSLMWVIGGYDGTNSFNDVWSSSDGVTWTQATKAAAFPARYYQTSLVYNNLIWVMGGLNGAGSALNDVWSSSDGVTWTQATKAAAFPARYYQTSLVYNNLIWVMGGIDSSSVPLNDVWYSSPTPVTPPTPPQPVLVTFQNQPNTITTDLSSYPIFVYDSQAATVTVNGQQMSIPNSSVVYSVPVTGPIPIVYYGGQLNFPLKPGANSFVVTASSSAGTLLWSVTKTITLDPNYSLAGRKLVYASVQDLANSAVTDTVVIDPAANSVLGYLPGEQVTATDPNGQFVVEFDGTANHLFSAATGVEGAALPFTAGAGAPQYPLMTADGYGYWGTQKVQWSTNSLVPVTLPKSVDSRRCSLLSGGLIGCSDFSNVYVMNDSSVTNTYPTAVASANHGYAAVTPDGAYALETSYAYAAGAIQSFRLKDSADAENPASDYLQEIDLSPDGTQAIIGAYGNTVNGGGGIYDVGVTTGGLLLPHGNTGPVVSQYGASSIAIDNSGTVYASTRFVLAPAGTYPQWGTPDNRGVAAFTFGSDGYLHLTTKYFLASQDDKAGGHRIVVKPAAK